MTQKRPPLEYLTLPEFAYIYDESDQKRVIAYRTDYRRQKTITFMDKILFTALLTNYTSEPFHCAGYRDLLLLIDLEEIDTPTDIYFNVEFSDDRSNWYKYMIGPFGDLRYEDTAPPLKESVNCPVLAPYVRIYSVATGTTAAVHFLATVKAIFNG